MKDLQLDQLRALTAVVDAGSFESAATRLGVTPSAVSQRIKALESAVGRVLVRRGKPAAATDSGTTLLRLARQLDVLAAEAAEELDLDRGGRVAIPLVINADSLATWVLPGLAALEDVTLQVFREDERHSTALLRDGTVMAAVTAVREPVQGCVSRPLGAMSYRPLCSPGFATRWFPGGAHAEALAAAPVVQFDHKDALQDEHLSERGVDPAGPPRHLVPGSGPFVEAVRLGMGWGMVPDLQSDDLRASGELVPLDGAVRRVPLYWQQWSLRSAALDRVARAVEDAATTLR
ncbi:MAG: LysR family transcriptional regulator ArgP [Actinomycetales bacterium]|nr:LysR family transcriptional regulator ArgP [Actinomycetales bacterium]